jgi:hypothetical protein
MNMVPGGMANTSPYFGEYRLASASSHGTELGDFLLASCGCGDWRVLFRPNDGSPKTTFPVQFYTSGEYSPMGPIDIYGKDGSNEAAGTVDQDAGQFAGRSQTPAGQFVMEAVRGSAHTASVEACGLCHIGDDSVYPLPPTHPDKYKTNPLVCLECHTVNGS